MNSKIIFSIIGVVFVLAASAGVFAWKNNLLPIPGTQGVACTTEAKICPDGSAVGRTGPNCEFAACPQSPTSSPAATETANLKTYTNTKYGFSFSYPSSWFLRESSDKESVYFSKTATTPPEQQFADIYVGSLGGASPQKFFEYYYGDDSRPTVNNQPRLESLQLGGVPVVHHLVVGESRYVAYTAQSEIGFVLHPGDGQNPTEYVPGDDALMRQVISTFAFADPANKFVTVDLSATWKTYTNTQYGFRMQYPPAFQAVDIVPQNPYDGSVVGFSDTPPYGYKEVIVAVLDHAPSNPQAPAACSGVEGVSTVNINGVVFVTGNASTEWGTGKGNGAVSYCTVKNNKAYSIIVRTDITSGGALTDISADDKQMVQSFIFAQ